VSTVSGVATVSVADGAVTSTGSSITLTGSGETVGAGLNADLNMSNPNTWLALQTFNDGLTAGGGQTNLNTADNDKVNIADGGGATNQIYIGYGTAPLSGNYTTTTFGGAVNFTGTVSLPAGAVSASSIGLAPNDILIGDKTTGTADTVHVTQDVTFENTSATAATALVNSSNAATFAVVNGETVGKTLQVTGQTTLGSTALAAATFAAPAPSSGNLVLNATNSYFILTDGGAAYTYTGISTGATPSGGQIVVVVNASTTPADYITLTSGAGMPLNGSSVIIGDGGTATLMYDATVSGWRLIGAQ
jgi:hypothetical protein